MTSGIQEPRENALLSAVAYRTFWKDKYFILVLCKMAAMSRRCLLSTRNAAGATDRLTFLF